MKENKTNWWMILILVVVVAVVASLITANFTGNVIKVNADKLGANKVYTKAEVDTQLIAIEESIKGINGNIDALSGNISFENCGPTNSIASSDTGNQACAIEGKRCVMGNIFVEYYSNDVSERFLSALNRVVNCDDTMDKYYQMYVYNEGIGNSTKVSMVPAWLCC